MARYFSDSCYRNIARVGKCTRDRELELSEQRVQSSRSSVHSPPSPYQLSLVPYYPYLRFPSMQARAELDNS